MQRIVQVNADDLENLLKSIEEFFGPEIWDATGPDKLRSMAVHGQAIKNRLEETDEQRIKQSD